MPELLPRAHLLAVPGLALIGKARELGLLRVEAHRVAASALAIAANDVLDLEVVGDRALTLRARAHGRGDLVATVHW